MWFPSASSTAGLVFAASLAAGVTGDTVRPRPLIPFKRQSSGSLQSRAWKRELIPKDIVILEYGMDAVTYPSTALKFTAHVDTPIVLLEDIEYLVDSISCYIDRPREHEAKLNSRSESVDLNFRSEEAYAEALTTWSSYPSFILVTSHLSCNLQDRRGAWLVSGVRGHETYPQIKLAAQPMPLREMGATFRVSHSSGGFTSSWRPPPALGARFDDVFEFGHTLDLAPRQQLFPPDNNLLQARADSNSAGGFDTFSNDVQVFCVDCVSSTNFSVGIELDVTDLGTKISAAHVNVTVQQFQHDIQLEFALDGTLSFSKSVDVIRIPLPDLGITIPDVATVGFFYGGSVSASLDIVGGLNFTIGAKTSIPSGATASFVMAGDGNSSATGWDSSSFDLVPFRLNGGSLNTTAQLSLSPFLDIEFDLLTKFSNQARLSVNTPQLIATAQLQTNVNRQCKPIGPDDFEFFTAALSFGAGANLEIQASANSTIPDLGSASATLFTHAASFKNFPAPDDPACFVVADDRPSPTVAARDTASGTAALAGLVPAATGTLLSAASAVPSFDIQKIEAYFSASGALPTNVNYTQLAQATQIPSNLQKAVTNVLHGGAVARKVPNVLLLVGVAVTAAWF